MKLVYDFITFAKNHLFILIIELNLKLLILTSYAFMLIANNLSELLDSVLSHCFSSSSFVLLSFLDHIFIVFLALMVLMVSDDNLIFFSCTFIPSKDFEGAIGVNIKSYSEEPHRVQVIWVQTCQVDYYPWL